MNTELSEILTRKTCHASFRKVNLHVHTPATPWCWNQGARPEDKKAGQLSPRDVAKAIVETDLEVIAITDHDTVSWVAAIQKEVKKLLRGKNRHICVPLSFT